MAIQPEDLVEKLRSVPLFAPLTVSEAELLVQAGRRAVYRHGQTLIQEGEAGTNMFVILSGHADVLQSTFEGNRRLLLARRPGDVIGELGLMDGKPRSASVVARDTCRTLVLEQRSFQQCLRRNPDLAISLIRSLAQSIREQNARIAQPDGAKARLMLFLAERLREEVESGEPLAEIELGQNFAHLAPGLGMTRETLSRIISELTQLRILKKLSRTRLAVHRRRFWLELQSDSEVLDDE